jgi:predicted Zn-dependent protease
LAIEKGREFLAVSPSDTATLFLVRALIVANQKEQAIVEAERWLDSNTGALVLWGEYANLVYQSGDLEKFEKALSSMLELDGDNVYALNGLAWLLKDTRPERALDYATRASLLAPDSLDVIDTLATVQVANRRFADAVRSANRGLSLDGTNAGLQLVLARALLLDERPSEAKAALTRLLQQDSSDDIREEAQALMRVVDGT